MSPFVESLVEHLFKYRPVVFEQGHFAFGASRSSYLVLLVGVAVVVPAVLTYGRARARSRRRDRVILGSMRLAAALLLLFCLLRPMLVLSAAVPQRNVLGIVIDDSRSMQIADQDGRPRSDFVERTFGGKDSALVAALSRRFLLRFFRFSRSAEPVADGSSLTFAGSDTRLGAALLGARQALASAPLSGLVLVTDGADNAPAERGTPALDDALHTLEARSVPVYTVGVGSGGEAKDIEISRVEAPRSVLAGATLVVNVMLVQHGFAGKRLPLVVEDSGHIVSTQSVEMPPDGEAGVVRVHVPATAAGARLFRFRIAPQPGETIPQNNAREALVVVEDRREKILYLEGEPRFEMKFLRRAVEADSNLQLVTLLRSAEGKFLRLGVEDSLELAGGFPTTRAELFGYRGIIIGSVEASFFTLDQMRMLVDYVSERGGGLMMLGGRRAFAEGGYAGTPLEEVMPIVLGPAAAGDTASSFFEELHIAPTPFGESQAAMQIAGSESLSVARWATLPPLSTVNRVRGARPGATVLLTGTDTATGDRQIVLAFQRYGRGKVIAFPVQDSWMWQMHADIPVDDMTHETLWRQMLRWLTSNVPERVEATASADRVGPSDPVSLRAEVSDKGFVRVNDARVVAHVTDPAGHVLDVPLEWTVDRDGEYRGSFTPAERGLYAIRVDARRGSDSLASRVTYVQSADLPTEYFDSGMRKGLLERIARETGGRFYTPATVGALPEDVVYTKSGTTVLEQKELWDMPAVLVLLLVLVAGEWGYRRARGLA